MQMGRRLHGPGCGGGRRCSSTPHEAPRGVVSFRESKEEPVSVVPDRSSVITPEGHERLQAELAQLVTTRRAEIAEWLRDAREDGSEPGENPGLGEALEQRRFVERQIAKLEHRLATARIVEPAADGTADVGAHVHLRLNGSPRVYQLVGALEADPSQRRLSIDSPVGRALLGRAAGDVVEVDAPKGRCRFEIVAIDSLDSKAA
jgi:transcription elongation factor GreA